MVAKTPRKASRPSTTLKTAPTGLKSPPPAGPVGEPERPEQTERGPHSPRASKRPRKRSATAKGRSTATPKPHLTTSSDPNALIGSHPATLLSLSEAAKAVGVSKSTIWRAVKAGKLSAASKTDEGEFRIDPSELERAFAETKRAAKVASFVKGDEAAAARIAGLEEMLAFAKDQLEKTEKDRDEWREQAQSAQRLLTDARPKRSWLWWRSKRD